MIIGYLKNAKSGDPPAKVKLPSELARLLEEARQSGFDDDKLAALSKFVAASFIPTNLDELEGMLTSMDDVDAESVSVYRAFFTKEGAVLPTVRVEAAFTVEFRQPISGDELLAWQEDNDAYLTDCISFWWNFGDPAGDWNGVFDCEEAGAHLGEAEENDD